MVFFIGCGKFWTNWWEILKYKGKFWIGWYILNDMTIALKNFFGHVNELTIALQKIFGHIIDLTIALKKNICPVIDLTIALTTFFWKIIELTIALTLKYLPCPSLGLGDWGAITLIVRRSVHSQVRDKYLTPGSESLGLDVTSAALSTQLTGA